MKKDSTAKKTAVPQKPAKPKPITPAKRNSIKKRRNTKSQFCSLCSDGLKEFQSTLEEPPKTSREFKTAIEQSVRRIWHEASMAHHWVYDVNFLNESTLEVLDGIAPLANEKHEKIRVAIAELEQNMFRRNNEGMDLLEAADHFTEDFRQRLRHIQPGSRWDHLTEAGIKLMAQTIAARLKGEPAKNYLYVFANVLTDGGLPGANAMVDILVNALYMASEARESAGMVGFVSESLELAQTLANTMSAFREDAEKANADPESEASTRDDDDKDFFDTNAVIGPT